MGLGVQFAATFSDARSVSATLWIILRFFTVTTNIGVAVVFTGIALVIPAARSPRLVSGVMLAIVLVGSIYALLLRGLLDLSGGAALADTLLHMVTPVIVPLYWLAFVPRGMLGARDPWLWAIYPALYLPYALARGLSGDIYAYPFINVERLGWAQVGINSLLIALAFVIAGFGVLMLDRWLAKRVR